MANGERWDEIFSGIHDNIPAEEIYQGLKRKKNTASDEKGRRSEIEFEKRVWEFFGKDISMIRPSTPEEDAYDAVDYFITLKNGNVLPAQIKSSKKAVNAFKQSQKFSSEFGQKIIVINANRHTPKRIFEYRFRSELVRIENLDKTSQTNNT